MRWQFGTLPDVNKLFTGSRQHCICNVHNIVFFFFFIPGTLKVIMVHEDLGKIARAHNYVMCGDPVYTLKSLLIEAKFNNKLSTVRQAVEWGFGKVASDLLVIWQCKKPVKAIVKLLLTLVQSSISIHVNVTICFAFRGLAKHMDEWCCKNAALKKGGWAWLGQSASQKKKFRSQQFIHKFLFSRFLIHSRRTKATARDANMGKRQASYPIPPSHFASTLKRSVHAPCMWYHQAVLASLDVSMQCMTALSTWMLSQWPLMLLIIRHRFLTPLTFLKMAYLLDI